MYPGIPGGVDASESYAGTRLQMAGKWQLIREA